MLLFDSDTQGSGVQHCFAEDLLSGSKLILRIKIFFLLCGKALFLGLELYHIDSCSVRTAKIDYIFIEVWFSSDVSGIRHFDTTSSLTTDCSRSV